MAHSRRFRHGVGDDRVAGNDHARFGRGPPAPHCADISGVAGTRSQDRVRPHQFAGSRPSRLGRLAIAGLRRPRCLRGLLGAAGALDIVGFHSRNRHPLVRVGSAPLQVSPPPQKLISPDRDSGHGFLFSWYCHSIRPYQLVSAGYLGQLPGGSAPLSGPYTRF